MEKPEGEQRMHPRLEAKIKELQKRDLLTKAKAYVPPQDAANRAKN